MPAKDKTGPFGEGALTGRGFGPCSGEFVPPCFFGRGRGVQRMSLSQPFEMTKEQEKKILGEQLAELEAEKKEIEKRLKK